MILPTIELEQRLWSQGYKFVVGIDEAGRGPLAGPVVAGAVIINNSDQIVEGVRDSKKLSKNKREKLYKEIREKSLAYGIGVSTSINIDSFGIQQAVKSAMLSALKEVEERLGFCADYLIVDGKGVLILDGYKMEKITKGDLHHYSIAAASILAKVKRDEIMAKYAENFPMYGFDSHVGYGTKAHIEAILKYGACEIHRKSFQPIAGMTI